MATIISLLTIIGSLLLAAFQWWENNQPVRIKEAHDAKVQQGRTDIANGDVDAVSVRIDQACSPGGSPILGNDQDTLRRIDNITNL